MRKLILSTFFIVCICAFPQKEPKLTLESVEIGDVVDISDAIREAILNSAFQPSDLLDCINYTNQTSLNRCIDDLVVKLDDWLAKNYEPLSIPDMQAGFNYTLIVNYHGEIDLTNGKLGQISTVHRTGDVNLSGDLQKIITLKAEVGFDTLSVNYDYSAKIMNLGPTGGIKGTVSDLALSVSISYDAPNKKFTLDEFQLTNVGKIKFKFTGHSMVDWLLNILTNTVTSLLKKVIVNVMENFVGTGLQKVIDLINEYIANHTSVAVAAPPAYPAHTYMKPILIN